MQRLLITGANRGIGLEFVRQGLARGEFVIATCREPGKASELDRLQHQYPERLVIEAMDVADQGSVGAASDSLHRQVDALDVLINNAGIYVTGGRPGTFRREAFRETYETNVIGPMMVAEAFLDLLRAGDQPVIMNLSSGMGSISQKSGGGAYIYSSSKAALNMLSRILANDLRGSGITVITMSPGWTQTDMGGQGAPLHVENSVGGMLRVLDGLTMDQSGRYYQWDGRELPW